jgi:hypothetical protein
MRFWFLWKFPGKSKGKRQISKGKSLFGSKAVIFQISKSHPDNRRKTKQKIKCRPFAFCPLPFAF